MSKERVVITGAAGFIGSHLAEALLDRGYAVIGIDNLLTGDTANIAHLRNRDFEFIKHDVTNYIYIEGPVHYVLHWASPASPIDYLELPIPTLKVGALGTHKALGLAKAKGATFVIASTSEVYGDPLEHPQKETYWGNVNPIGPRGVYDEAKRFAEAMTMAYHRYHGVDTKIVRIFNTYGPRMRIRDGRAVPAFISQALRNEDVTVFGDGRQTRSFCYVSDLVDGIIRLMLSTTNDPVNIGNPAEMTIEQIARDHHRDDRLEEQDRLPAAAGGRSEGAQARHHARAHAARLGAEGRSARRADEHDRLLPHEGSGRLAGAFQRNVSCSCRPIPRSTLYTRPGATPFSGRTSTAFSRCSTGLPAVSAGAAPLTIEALRPRLAAALAAYDIEPSFEREEQIVSGDWAFERGWDVQAVKPRAGGPGHVQRQRVFLILRRGTDGRWRFARGMSQPGPTT